MPYFVKPKYIIWIDVDSKKLYKSNFLWAYCLLFF